jgi:SAM-dependent methyltransferase
MNSGLEKTDHASFQYYDSDYPSTLYPEYPENIDDVLPFQGLKNDIEKYLDLAAEMQSDILELCCGTGRVAIPLLIAGYNVTAVDFTKDLLQQMGNKINKIKKIPGRADIVLQDITRLELDKKDFGFVIMAFNSLLCITDFNGQLEALQKASEHMRTGGILALDLMNPLSLNFHGDGTVSPFFTRKNIHNGNIYTRFAAVGAMNENQVQKLYGWYDEIDETGTVKRRHYEMAWKPVFRFEIQLMLERAGFRIRNIYGGHKNEPFSYKSRKMFIEAVKL